MAARCLTLVLCGAILLGCSSDKIRDLSGHPPFNAYVGRTVHLLEPVYLMYEDFWTGPEYGISTAPITGEENYPLRVGHPIYIDSVKLNLAFTPYLLAHGHTFVPALGKEMPVHFYWGDLKVLDRAPWEPKTLPEIRTINDPALLRSIQTI